jgi:hypothetical protein
VIDRSLDFAVTVIVVGFAVGFFVLFAALPLTLLLWLLGVPLS